ncbi:unnamed protein product, partial [Mesorhabditis spiculigera]
MNSTASKSTRSVQNDTAIEATEKNETWRVDPETLAAYGRNPEQWLVVCPPVADGDMSVCYTLRNTTSLIQQESGCRTLFKKHFIPREGLICSMNHEKALKNPGTEYCVCYTTNCNKPKEQE